MDNALFSMTTILHIDNTPLLGWWMVLAGDEQGYAPASLLEPLDDNSPTDEDVCNDQGV